ncbi:MAG: glycosyltransferase family 4 protein [Microbacteriaceae bacterium]|nr:glycosyltransferase family 4 protein [Microbacteriaceae bacterium]
MSALAAADAPVRILFDCRYTRLDRHDGISRYTARLVEEVGKRHAAVTMLVSDLRQLAMLPDLPHVLGPPPTSLLEPFIGPRALNRLRPDVVFSPLQTIGPLGRRYKLVTTIHDLIYYEHPAPPRDLPGPVRLMWRLYHTTYAFQRWVLRLADAHVTISETTAGLMRRHRMSRRPIAVILNGVDHVAHPPRAVPAGRDVLYAGSFMPYKDVETLAAAMHHLPGRRLRLLSRASEAIKARLSALAPAGAIDFMDGASDVEYAAALESSRVLATASRAEGFGLPVVEAMAAGTPVAIADTPIFREVAGEHASYFPVGDAEGAARAIRELDDDELWLRRSTEGEAWSRRYDWGRAGEQLLAFLLRVARG